MLKISFLGLVTAHFQRAKWLLVLGCFRGVYYISSVPNFVIQEKPKSQSDISFESTLFAIPDLQPANSIGSFRKNRTEQWQFRGYSSLKLTATSAPEKKWVGRLDPFLLFGG